MATPDPDDLEEAPIPAPTLARPPMVNDFNDPVKANVELKRLFKQYKLNEGQIRAFALLGKPKDVDMLQDMVKSVPDTPKKLLSFLKKYEPATGAFTRLDEPEDVVALHNMIKSAPDTIEQLHSFLNGYGADKWMEVNNFPKRTLATRIGTPLGLSVDAEPRANMLTDERRPFNTLPPSPRPYQAPSQPSSSSQNPHGSATASVSRSQSVATSLSTSKHASQGNPPKWRPNKRPKPGNDLATQVEPQNEFYCPCCHKKYDSLGWFESHFANKHLLAWFGDNFGEFHLFGCGFCYPMPLYSGGGDVHVGMAYEGWNAIVAHVSLKHSRYQEKRLTWSVDAAIRNVLCHDIFRSMWYQFFAEKTLPDPESVTYLFWNATEKEQDNLQLLFKLQAVAPSLPAYVPGRPHPDHVRPLMRKAYELADKHTVPSAPTLPEEQQELGPVGI
ncbi:hypothetical protein IQ07DRAFT_15208 [Pyrenochaeta sp. DS3sAY3a]|nr:hypothetical protein IQ07DRAFT_15208 [Pyrenochaeta sp. DS3sAY3a]